jgi:3-oxoacyl-[acyl-carrier-protein] synthase III
MTRVTANEVHLLGAASALPGPAIDNAALGRRLGMDRLWEQWVEAFIGTRARHLATDLDSGKQRHTLTGLGERAARGALEAAGIGPDEIDVVVMGTATPDKLMPATVNMIADRLGIDSVPSYQLQSGCSGAVQALDVASRFLTGPQPRTALVIGGDVVARFYDLSADLSKAPPAELVNYVVFGDGAGAAVISSRPRPGSLALRGVFTRLVGRDREPGALLEWFGPADRHSTRPAATEDYKAIEAEVPVMSREVLDELLAGLGWRPDQVDFVLPPQLSGVMTAKIVKELDLPGAEELSFVADTGNCGNAIVFLQLERALARLGPGQRAVGISIESSKWIKSGFALEHTGTPAAAEAGAAGGPAAAAHKSEETS